MGHRIASDAANQRDSQINHRRVLREVWAEPGISRIAIAQSLGLNKSTVTKIVSDLLEQGMLQEGGTGEAGPAGGRRPVGLALNSAYGAFGGISVRALSCECGLFDFAGGTVWCGTRHIDMRGDRLAPGIEQAVALLLDHVGPPLLGIGIALPGIVDPDHGVLLSSIPMEVKHPVPIANGLSHLAPLLRVENDANALCWGELMDPSQPELSDFLCVLGETRPETPDIPVSVGLGFALGGAVHHGPEYSSGEFRSPLWNDDGPGQFRLPADVLRRIQHDSDALDALVDETAVGVSFLVNALNLSSVFLEGFFAEDFDRHARTIENALDRYWPYPGSPSCSVNRAGRGEPALCIGAAALIQHEYYGRTYLPNGIPSAG